MVHLQLNKPAKYNNVAKAYGGRVYHSAFEAGVAKELDTLRKAADPAQRVVEVVPQYKCEIRAPSGKLLCNHYVDFFVIYADGGQKLIEAKGYATDVWALKRRLLEELWLPANPGVTYEVWQQRPDRDWARAMRKKQRDRAAAWRKANPKRGPDGQPIAR